MPAAKDEVEEVLAEGIVVKNGWGPKEVQRAADGTVTVSDGSIGVQCRDGSCSDCADGSCKDVDSAACTGDACKDK